MDDVTCTLFPNPSSHEMHLEINPELNLMGIKTRIEIFTLEGKLIHSENLDQSQVILHKQHFGEGAFLCKIHVGNQSIVKKLIFN
jgi:hypothetical protein